MKQRYCSVLLGVIVGLVNPANVNAEPQDGEAFSPAQSLNLENKKDELLGLLAQVDERYGDVAATLKSIEAEIARSNQALDKIRKEIAVSRTESRRLNEELAGQVKAAYVMGEQERLKLLLNQKDTTLSSRMMMYYEYINKARLVKLANSQNMVKYLDQLEQDKQVQASQLNQMLAEKRIEQTALDDVKKQRDQLVARLNNGAFSEEEQLSFLRLSENKLIDLLNTLEHDTGQDSPSNNEGEPQEEPLHATLNIESFPRLTGNFVDLKGKLPLPVRGKISSMANDAAWKGVLIGAKEGAEIRAITAGQIVYAGLLKGYGLLVIVEHDNRFMTLYAFNQSLIKHKGDKVQAGDVIATVGQSGGRNKPGLYFEIRHNGKPVDPLLWCRG
jgi:murein hydrolase activator